MQPQVCAGHAIVVSTAGEGTNISVCIMLYGVGEGKLDSQSGLPVGGHDLACHRRRHIQTCAVSVSTTKPEAVAGYCAWPGCE